MSELQDRGAAPHPGTPRRARPSHPVHRCLRGTLAWAFVLGLVPGCGGEPSEADASKTSGLNAVLISLDTTRRDALSCYGAAPAVTPELARFAEGAQVFDAAHTVAPITLPSHASMLTGLVPLRHGVRVNGLHRLSSAAETLAERARGEGIQTAAFVAAAVLDETYGLAQGFDHYDQVPRISKGPGPHYTSRSGKEVVDAALAWVRGERDPNRPFLLWIHLFDPHLPYAPRPRLRARVGGDPYLAEVAAMDRELGRFFEGLRTDGLYDGTAIAVVADHGESRGEHGEATHGATCYRSVMHVPFLLRDPGGQGSGSRVDARVSVADVAPTLAEALGLPPFEGIDGLSLWRRSVPEDRGVYVESYYGHLHYGWSPLAGWIDRNGKYLHSSTPELYDPARDPGETRNLVREGRNVAPYIEALEALSKRPALATSSLDPDADRAAALGALGYATGGAALAIDPPLLDRGLPSPASSTEELHWIDEAFRRAQSESVEGAIEAWGQVRAKNPRNATALQELSFHMIRAQRFREAEDLIQALLGLGVERAVTYMNLGYCLEQRNDLEGALAAYERALVLDPRDVPVLNNAIGLTQRMGLQERHRELLEQRNAVDRP